MATADGADNGPRNSRLVLVVAEGTKLPSDFKTCVEIIVIPSHYRIYVLHFQTKNAVDKIKTVLSAKPDAVSNYKSQ